MVRTPRLALGLLALALAGCTTTASPSPSALPSAAAGEPAAVCDPATPLTLIGPDGSQVVLGNGPGGTSAWDSSDGGTFFLREVGDCVWMVGSWDVGTDPPLLSLFHGRLLADFRIVGTFSDNTGVQIRGYDHGDWVYKVTFEGSEIVLVEDRTDTGPPGCTGGDSACPAPRELRRAGT